MIFRKQKKVDLVFLVFGAIALFVIISLSIIMYLLFNRYHDNNIRQNNSNFVQEVDLPVYKSPEELKASYQKELQNLVTFVESSDLEISKLLSELENKMLEVRVPTEEREKFLSATLQIVRMQDNVSALDKDSTKSTIIEILNSIF